LRTERGEGAAGVVADAWGGVVEQRFDVREGGSERREIEGLMRTARRAGVGGETDDAVWHAALECFAYRAAAVEMEAGEGLVDDSGVGVDVVRGEVAAVEQRNAHCAEPAGGGGEEVGFDLRAAAVDADGIHGGVAGHQRPPADAGRFDAG